MKKRRSFAESRYRRMLISGTFAMGIDYLMLLLDTVIAGIYIGKQGTAAVNLVIPLIEVVAFLSMCISEGVSIRYSRAIGEVDKEWADQVYGLGLLATLVLSLLIPATGYAGRDLYFALSGVSGKVLEEALAFYKYFPIEAGVIMWNGFLVCMIYCDGDASLNTCAYALQIFSNILVSGVLAYRMGIEGIMIGNLVGNVLSVLVLSLHFFRKENTLHFRYYFSWKELGTCFHYSIVDALVYILWGSMDFMLIIYVSRHYDEDALVILAIVMSLIEMAVLFDGIGMAIQPQMGIYLGEENQVMIKRLISYAIRSALIEGILFTLLVDVLAPQLGRFYGVSDPGLLQKTVTAIRIVSLGLVADSLLMLETSYYLYTDHISISILTIILKDGILYMGLPLLLAPIMGLNGLWLGLALAPPLGLLISFGILYLWAGKERFPYLLDGMNNEIRVYDTILSESSLVGSAQLVQMEMEKHGYRKDVALRAGMFVNEIGTTLLEKNGTKEEVQVEYSLMFAQEQATLIVRDSGIIMDITDPDMKISGQGSYVLSRMMRNQKTKTYMTTMGYNRNMISFEK